MNYEQKHPILQKLEEYFNNTPKEQIDKDWSDILKDTDSEAYYEQKYKQALERARKAYIPIGNNILDDIFPELAESEDERIRKAIYNALKYLETELSWDFVDEVDILDVYAWLEKQGDTNETINKDKFAQGVLRGAAINLITWIDYNAAEGNMCLSNMECKDIEDALVSGDWDKIYAYIKKKLEKQGEKKSADEVLKIRQELYQSGYNDGYKHGQEDITKSLSIGGEQKQTWKPSEAQLIVIGDLIKDKNTSNVNKTILRGMLDEFKQFTNTHKREIDDAYLQGICDAKHEIEKQDESSRTNIEIPFGANDSELQEMSYYIPKGFYAEIKDDRVVIKKVEPKFKVGDCA